MLTQNMKANIKKFETKIGQIVRLLIRKITTRRILSNANEPVNKTRFLVRLLLD